VLQSWQILPLSTRQRTFFKYEKRIRDLSGPDKIFEYFATETKDGSRSVPSGSLGCAADHIALTTAHVTLPHLPQTYFPSSTLSRTGYCRMIVFAWSNTKLLQMGRSLQTTSKGPIATGLIAKGPIATTD